MFAVSAGSPSRTESYTGQVVVKGKLLSLNDPLRLAILLYSLAGYLYSDI